MANFNRISSKPHNEITVAKSGGDERRIQKALDSAKNIAEVTRDGDTAPVTVKVYPGTYIESDNTINVWNDTILYGVVEGAVIVDANINLYPDGQIYNIIQKSGRTYTEL